MSLLSKAKKVPFKKNQSHQVIKFKEEEIQLALAWLRDEIGYKQINQVMGVTGGSAYSFLLRALKAAHRESYIS
jgi:hypothetical protein